MAAGVEGEHDPVHRAGRAGRRDAEPEPDRGHEPGVDPEQARRRRVLHGRPDRTPELREPQDREEQAEHHERRHECVDPGDRDVVAEDRPVAIGVAGDRRAIRRLVRDAEEALDPERDRPGDEKRELFALVVTQRPQEDELQDDPEREHRGGDHDQPDERVEPKIAVQRVAQVRAENDQRALSHVDDTHHAEAEREPARHQGVDPTGKQPENAGLDEDVHLSR